MAAAPAPGVRSGRRPGDRRGLTRWTFREVEVVLAFSSEAETKRSGDVESLLPRLLLPPETFNSLFSTGLQLGTLSSTGCSSC